MLDCQFTEVGLGFAEECISELEVDVPEAKGAQFCLVGLVFIALIENGVQDLLCLDLAMHVFGPQPVGHSLVQLVEVFVVGQ